MTVPWPGLVWPLLVLLGAWLLAWAAFRGIARLICGQERRAEEPADKGTARTAFRAFAGLAAIALFGFAALTAAAMTGPPLKALDDLAFALVTPWREPAVSAAFAWLTRFGNVETLIALTVGIAALLAATRRSHSLTVFLVSVLGAHIIGWVCKLVVGRARPETLADVAVHSSSFPSLHAAGAVSVYVAFAWVLAREVRRPAARFHIAFWLTALALAISWSRIVLGVHFATDVIAGLLLGSAWVCLGIAAGIRWDAGRPEPA